MARRIIASKGGECSKGARGCTNADLLRKEKRYCDPKAKDRRSRRRASPLCKPRSSTLGESDCRSVRQSKAESQELHAMQRRGAPLRMIAPGRVFRRDTHDPTHNPMFFQVEGLCVDRGISMAHLKGTVAEFLRRMFGAQTVTRFRPSYFPFTEPSAEFDFSCFKCGGTGCRICKNSGWIELGGSGMVHPNVLRGAGVDPDEFSGFAFGLGIDRMVALMYGLDDIRLLFENDVRFLEQFD